MADNLDQTDGQDGFGVPPGWHPNGLMAGVPAMNAAAARSTLGAVMTPEQIADVDWGDTPPPQLPPWTVTGQNPGLVPMQSAAPGAADSNRTPPDPAGYARMGEFSRDLQNNPSGLDGSSDAAGMLYGLGQLAQFHRGGSLDAQAQGSSPADGNYDFGVYNAAAGRSLPDTLDLANTYGKYFSNYPTDPDAKGYKPMDENYEHIPAENVENITKGYNDYQTGQVGTTP